MAPQVVKLNVGGTFFATTRQTLSRCPGTVLADLISDHNPTACLYLDGAIFIDRSPEHFQLILDWLRGCKPYLLAGSQEANLLLEEAEFYGLSDLAKALTPKPEDKSGPGPVLQVPAMLAVGKHVPVWPGQTQCRPSSWS